MDVYTLPIAFKASPSSTFATRELGLPSSLGRDVVAECGNRSVRVRKARSPQDAEDMARDLQSAFEAQHLPEDVERRVKKKFS